MDILTGSPNVAVIANAPNWHSTPFEEIEPYLKRLPEKEAAILRLYYTEKVNQKDIAKMFGITQGAVSSRLTRAGERINFLKDLPSISEEELEYTLGQIFGPIEMEIIKCMLRTTCQRETASLINDKFKLIDRKRMTQPKVRHRFEKCVKYLETAKELNPEMIKYFHLLDMIKKNLYMLHEVKQTRFKSRSDTRGSPRL